MICNRSSIFLFVMALLACVAGNAQNREDIPYQEYARYDFIAWDEDVDGVPDWELGTFRVFDTTGYITYESTGSQPTFSPSGFQNRRAEYDVECRVVRPAPSFGPGCEELECTIVFHNQEDGPDFEFFRYVECPDGVTTQNPMSQPDNAEDMYAACMNSAFSGWVGGMNAARTRVRDRARDVLENEIHGVNFIAAVIGAIFRKGSLNRVKGTLVEGTGVAALENIATANRFADWAVEEFLRVKARACTLYGAEEACFNKALEVFGTVPSNASPVVVTEFLETEIGHDYVYGTGNSPAIKDTCTQQ